MFMEAGLQVELHIIGEGESKEQFCDAIESICRDSVLNMYKAMFNIASFEKQFLKGVGLCL